MATRTNATAQRTGLSRERVLHAAVAFADESGIEALSMRKLAKELGVEAMSLYNHVANKGDLVDAMVDLILHEVELPPDEKPWDAAIRDYAISAHEVLLRHRWACSLVMSPTSDHNPRKSRMLAIEWLLRRLREAGFSPELTYSAYHTLDAHILGFTLWQLGHTAAARDFAGRDLRELAAGFLRELSALGDFRYFAEHVEQHLNAPKDDSAREFEFGLDLILDGLKRARRKR